MQINVKDVLLRLCILLMLYDCATCLIIPEELPTILSLIYSNIPPIKKGTDSRIGIGFRLGEHADFQVLLELGPQTETEPIGNADTKRRRAATLTAAMRGEMGPLAQAVAKYQIERKLQKEIERLKILESERQKSGNEESQDNKTSSSQWLTKWKKEIMEYSDPLYPNIEGKKTFPKDEGTETIQQRVGQVSKSESIGRDKFSELSKLYKLQPNNSKD